MVSGRAPAAGERFTAPAHARALKRIAETKGQAFYTGDLAENMAAHARKHGGALTVADLAQHKANWVEPLAQDYRGYTLYEIPPNGQGIAAQMALGILEGFDLAALAVDSADSLHLQIEAVNSRLPTSTSTFPTRTPCASEARISSTRNTCAAAAA